MNHNGVLDYFGGTDNMSIFGSTDPIAEQFVVGSQEYQDAGMALDRQRGIGQVAKEQHPETQEIFDMLPARQPVISAQMLKNYIKSGHSKNISELITGTPSDNIRKDIPEAKRGGKESSIFSDIGDWLGDKENMARLGIGLNSLRLNPDAALAASLQKSIDGLQKSKASKAKATQAVASLLKLGRTDLATAVSEGVMDPGDAIKLAFKKEKVSARDKNIELFESDPERFAALKESGAIGGGGTTVNVGGQDTEFNKAVDKAYADDYLKWTGGGAADTVGNLAKIQDVLSALESGDKLTGPIIGQMPDFAMAFLNPEAVASREAVEGVVQRNLKAVLGAQFTEKEGEKLIKRAFNPTLSGAENAKRLKVLIQQIQIAAQQKTDMADYARKNGTLAGYAGAIPNVADFHKALDIVAPASLTKSQDELLKRYNLR